MKKIININLSGRVVPIEDSAYESLQRYIESLRRHFANEDGRDEIINDIESRIAELFDGELKKGATVITDAEVAAVINSIGRPEDFDTEEINTATTEEKKEESHSIPQSAAYPRRLYRDENNKILGGVCSGLANYFAVDPVVVRVIFVLCSAVSFFPYIILWIAVPSTATKVIGGIKKKLYRDPDDKVIAGVCSGIGQYFSINPWIPRILFLLPFVSIVFRWNHWGYYDFSFPQFLSFSFSPGALVIYIILWLVVPEAITTAEKLEMKGEKIDLNSIKNSVMEEMKGVQQRAEKMGKEARGFAQEKSRMIREDVAGATRRSRGTFGRIIVMLAKMFMYIVLACIAIGLIIGLFTIAIFAIGIFPLKDYVLEGGMENLFAWGTLLLFIGVPIIGVITMIIRRIARVRTRNRMMRLSFLGFWFLGVFCFLGLLYSLRMDFAAVNNYYEENVALANPTVPKLELTSSSNFQRFKQDRWFRIKPFPEVFEDTAYVRNVEVQIIKASSDSFRVTITKFVNGQTKEKANTLASHINFNASQIDTLLIADKSIAITKEDKFRNQHVILTIYVPVGKRIRVDQSFGWSEGVRFGGSWNNNWWDYYDDNNVEHGWEHDIDYVMKSDGLYTLDGEPADEYKRHQRKRQNNQEEINGDNEDQHNRKQELQDELRRIEQQEKADSIQRKKDSASQKTGAQEIEGNSGESTLINRSSKKPVATKLPFIDNFSPLII